MPPKRKVVYLSRFFEENVELVANMCVKCYQQEDEVKVTAINRNFSNAIKSRRLESLQKKRKLKETNSEKISSDFITQQLDEKFDENSSVSTDSEEASLYLHDSSSSELEEDNSLNLTCASNVSLNEIRTNIVSQSINNNSCHFLDNDDTFDQTCDTLSNNTDKITDCENTCKKFEHISKDTEATFKNIFNNVIKNDENTTPNHISSSAAENTGETIWINILNKIKSESQYEEDTSSDSSEENFNFFQAKTEHISTEKISVTSQSIFKTLNSKNSRLYDDFSTNINSCQNYKPKFISSVKYNIKTVQLKGCTSTLSNGDLTSVNNDKRCVSSSQYNEEIVKTTNDDSIIALINRIHSPIEFLTDNNKINVAKEEQINALKEDKLIEETQDSKIIEDKLNLEEIKTTEENIIEDPSLASLAALIPV
ncbi:hypothetical protein CBL_02330 [Carabus blaptoides fortunei]